MQWLSRCKSAGLLHQLTTVSYCRFFVYTWVVVVVKQCNFTYATDVSVIVYIEARSWCDHVHATTTNVSHCLNVSPGMWLHLVASNYARSVEPNVAAEQHPWSMRSVCVMEERMACSTGWMRWFGSGWVFEDLFEKIYMHSKCIFLFDFIFNEFNIFLCKLYIIWNKILLVHFYVVLSYVKLWSVVLRYDLCCVMLCCVVWFYLKLFYVKLCCRMLCKRYVMLDFVMLFYAMLC